MEPSLDDTRVQHDTDWEIVDGQNKRDLLDLPAELILHVLSFLRAQDLAKVAQTCRQLCVSSYDESNWLPLINEILPNPISTAGPAKTFRQLFIAHQPHWFLLKHRIWFGDSEPSGKLLLARYNEETGSIEAHTVAAARGPQTLSFWEKDREVIVHSFNPKVSLDLHQPVVKLNLDSPKADNPPNDHPSDRSYAPESLYSKEILMDTFSESGLYSSFMLCRSLPERAISASTYVWPPLRFPAPSRTRNLSQDGYNSAGHRPTKFEEISQNNFRLRKWVEYTGRRANPNIFSFGSATGLSAALGIGMPYFASGQGHGVGGGMTIRMPEDITTYATLPESCYTPTPQKPYQGIWCGDYSGHGCEFLLITQPDKRDERPLPDSMGWLLNWFRGGRRGSASSTASFVSAMEEFDTAAAADDADAAQREQQVASSSQQAPGPRLDGFSHPPMNHISGDFSDFDDVPTGRLEAIKLTGDPNIPRGEYTFIAPDLGHGGFIRVADEELFKGARVVRSAGHIAGRNFRHDQYTPSQLILMSGDRLAQFWEGFGHISYYQRVDLAALVKGHSESSKSECAEEGA